MGSKYVKKNNGLKLSTSTMAPLTRRVKRRKLRERREEDEHSWNKSLMSHFYFNRLKLMLLPDKTFRLNPIQLLPFFYKEILKSKIYVQ